MALKKAFIQKSVKNPYRLCFCEVFRLFSFWTTWSNCSILVALKRFYIKISWNVNKYTFYGSMCVIHRSTFRAQFTKQDWALTKLTKTHLSSTSLKAMISSMTSLTLSCNQVWHINLRFFLSKIPKMAFILRFKKIWKKISL